MRILIVRCSLHCSFVHSPFSIRFSALMHVISCSEIVLEMLHKCSAYGWKSGCDIYVSVNKEEKDYPSIHYSWIPICAKNGLGQTLDKILYLVSLFSSKMCSGHFFNLSNFVPNAKDSKKSRLKKRSGCDKATKQKTITRCYEMMQYLPSIYAPSYLSTTKQIRSTSKSSASFHQ